MTHEQKIEWMATWCAKNGLQLVLEGECGIMRECVGVSAHDNYPDYTWYEDHGSRYERADNNGNVWCPPDAYHKHDCVAVLGRGEKAEAQLYDWLKWFDENNFKLEVVERKLNKYEEPFFAVLLGRTRHVRLVKQA